jgi:hypothetical protein
MPKDLETIDFKQSKLITPMETDRLQLKEGIKFDFISRIVISTKTRYGKVARIDGNVAGKEMKYWTTSKPIISKCEEALRVYGDEESGVLNPRISNITVVQKTSEGKPPRNYLDFD